LHTFYLYSAIRRPWDQPKVLLNAARISRGPWRLAAFVDREGNVSSQNFHGLWLKAEGLTYECLAAILSGPVANVFVATHERGKHNQKRTLEQIPFPPPEDLNCQALSEAVGDYVRALRDDRQGGLINEGA
jgi:hypothetical protein